MNIVPLDGAKLLILMIAGAVFATAGLWLMMRPRPGGSAAKLEILGMKFESSSAGLLVFLIGAGFLAAPLIVPERIQPAATAPAREAPSGKTALGIAAEEGPADGSGETAGAGAEVEKNDRFASANPIELGTSVAGSLLDRDIDVFAVAIPPGTRGQITASLLATKGQVGLTLFDGAGQVVGSERTYASQVTASVNGEINNPKYFALVANKEADDSEYHLTMGVRQD